MPVTYSNIGLQEPSTITNKVAAVSIDRGSTTEQQEILVLGDPQSSLGLAQVVASDPASTAYGLVVRPVGYSTTVQVSSLAGTVLVSPVSTASMRVAQSTAADLQATVTPASTVWAVQAAQSGAWSVRADLSSTAADNPVSAAQSGTWTVRATLSSTAADNPVTVSGYSTTVNVSSLAGIVAVRASDTNWASSAGFHFNSSGELLTAGAAAAGSTQVSVREILTSSGVSVMDSTETAIRVNVVAGSAGGSTVVTVSTGSVRVHQSTAADLQVTAAQGGSWTVRANLSSTSADNPVSASQAGAWSVGQASTVWAVQLTQYSTTANVSSLAGRVLVDQNSTVWPVQVSSVAGVVTVAQNSTTWAVQLSNYSTVAQVSSVGGVVTVTPSAGSTFSVRPVQSSQADLRVTVYQSTAADLVMTARAQDGAGNALESSTSAPSTGARGLVVRPVFGGAQTYAASTTGQSSATTLVSSAAGSKAFVYAISVTSTLGGPVYWGFYDGATLKWTGVCAAPSSAISGVNLAVSPPAYLFQGSTGSALTFNVETSNTGLRVSAAYWVST